MAIYVFNPAPVSKSEKWWNRVLIGGAILFYLSLMVFCSDPNVRRKQEQQERQDQIRAKAILPKWNTNPNAGPVPQVGRHPLTPR